MVGVKDVVASDRSPVISGKEVVFEMGLKTFWEIQPKCDLARLMTRQRSILYKGPKVCPAS